MEMAFVAQTEMGPTNSRLLTRLLLPVASSIQPRVQFSWLEKLHRQQVPRLTRLEALQQVPLEALQQVPLEALQQVPLEALQQVPLEALQQVPRLPRLEALQAHQQVVHHTHRLIRPHLQLASMTRAGIRMTRQQRTVYGSERRKTSAVPNEAILQMA